MKNRLKNNFLIFFSSLLKELRSNLTHKKKLKDDEIEKKIQFHKLFQNKISIKRMKTKYDR
jgi:hypothetical protein